MSEHCTAPCPREDEVKRIIGELSVLIDFIRVQLAMIVPQEATVR